MADEERKFGDMEVTHAIHVGDREVLLLIDPNSEECPYLVCYNKRIPGLGLDNPTEIVGGADYLEAMDEFLRRVQGQVDQVRTESILYGEPQEVLGKEHCLPSDGMEPDLHGRVVVIKPTALRPEYRGATYQIVYVSGGFGAAANARGSAVFGNNVYSGDKSDWRRPDVLGILDPTKAPDWVKPGVEAIRAQLKEKGGKPHER